MMMKEVGEGKSNKGMRRVDEWEGVRGEGGDIEWMRGEGIRE